MFVSLKVWWHKPARGIYVALFGFFYPLLMIGLIQIFNCTFEWKTGLSSREIMMLIFTVAFLPPLVSFWRLNLNPLPKMLNAPLLGVFYLPVMLYIGFFFAVTVGKFITGIPFYI